MNAYRLDIDGLRAIAVLSVFAYHLNHSFLHGGFIGVDIFFVISGFLLSFIIFKEISTNTFSFANFYKRRIKRILPAFFFMCFITFIVSFFILFPNELESYRISLTRTLFFWQNMFFAQNTSGYWDLAAQEMPLLHTWSLAVEEQFYILLPLGTFIAYKLGLRLKGIAILLIIFAIASFSLSQFTELIDERILKYNYYSLPTSRAGELLIGSLLAILTLKIPNKLSNTINTILSIIAFITLLCSLIFMSDKLFFPSFWVVIPTLSVAVLIYANNGGGLSLNSPNIISRFLSLSPMVFVGKISYSLYLWHWVVIVLYKKYYLLDTLGNLDLVIVIALSFALSTFSYYIIERPCRYNNLSFIKSAILFYVLPALIVSAIFVGDKKFDLLDRIQGKIYGDEIIKDIKRQLDYASVVRQDYCHARIVGNCIFGDTSKKPTILMIGDSQAGHFTPLVESAGKMYGFSAKIFIQGGCFPFGKNKDKKCQEITQKAIDILNDYQTIIIAGRYVGYNDMSISNILEFINMLENRGKKIVIFKQVFELNQQIYNDFLRDSLHDKVSYDKYKNIFIYKEVKTNQEIEKAIKDKAIFYDALKDMSDEHKASFPFYNGLILYMDFNHLNYYGIQQIVKEVLPKQKDFWLNISGQK